MLKSVEIQRRQSEIRQSLAELVGKDSPTEDETRSMGELDNEYRANETRYRAALIAEDEERRDAKDELETRSDREYAELIGRFEMRQVALALDEGRTLDGPTAEIVQEMRNQGGYRGIPVPWQALELRAGETIASGTPDPIQTRPIIDAIFPDSVAGRMGAEMLNIDAGEVEWPVVTQGASVSWQSTEAGSVGSAQAFQTTDRPLAPDHTLGVQMKLTRKSLKQSGAAMEQAVRRDMNSAISAELDRVVFMGVNTEGEPDGVILGASNYGITDTGLDAEPTYANFLTEIVAFMSANAIKSPGEVMALMHPELFGYLESNVNETLQITEYQRLALLMTGRKPTGFSPQNIVISGNAIDTPTESPPETQMLMATSTGGVAPIFVGTWGGIDLIRDPYTDAASGGLRLTGLATMDVTVARPAQLRVLSGIQIPSS
ncbi:phage major capsid protein [Hoeflea sp. CAU 1731]